MLDDEYIYQYIEEHPCHNWSNQ